MYRLNISAASLFAIVALAGCNSAKSPDAVANDVATAQQKSAADVANAERNAVKATDSAENKVDDKTRDLNVTEAKGAYDVAITKADGDQKVATEKCKVLAGDAQKACIDQADAKHALAIANAKAALAAQKP